MVGQEHLLGPGRPLRRLIEADRLTSVILWGPPGTGKTTLARLIAGVTARSFETLSAVNAGVKDVREVVARAKARLGEHGQGTILFLDEVHRFNKSQQDALLPHVEDGLLTLIGATTENPYFEVNAPLLSRSSLFRLHGLSPEAVRALLHRGLEAEGATADDEALDHLVNRSDGDARTALNALEVAVALRRRRAGQSPWPRPRPPSTPGPCATSATTTTTWSRPSSSRSGAPTPTPASTGWPACWRRGRTPASSPAGW